MANYVVPYAPQGQLFTPNFRLVELLREQGSDAADAELRHGAINAQLATTLGTIPGQMIAAQRAGQESQLRDQAMQANAIDLKQKQKDADDRATMSRIWQGAYGMAPSQQPGFVGPTQPGMPEAGELPPGFETTAGGVKIPSTAFLSKALAAAGLGEHIPAMLQSNAKTAEAFATLAETQGKVAIQTANALGAVGAQALDAIDHGVDPTSAFHFAALTAKINNAVTNEQLTPYLDLAQDPTKIRPMLQALVKGSAEQQKLGSEKTTADARMMASRTQQYSDAGITQQLAEASLAKQQGGTVPTVPPLHPPPGLPGALPSVGGPPLSLNPQTGQPVIAPDDITGGSVNPIAPSLSPASTSMLATAPIGTSEAPAPPAMSEAEQRAAAALAAHQQVKGDTTKITPGSEADAVTRARRIAVAANNGQPLTDAQIQRVDAQAMQAFKAANADPELRAAALAQKNIALLLAKTQLGQVPTKEDAASVAEDLVAHRLSPSQMNAQFRTLGNAGLAFKLNVTTAAKKLDPTFNFEQAEAEYQLVKSTSFQNTVRYMDSALESIPRLNATAAKLGNGNFRSLNQLVNASQNQFNATDLKRFKVDALLVGDEVAKILAGGGSGNSTSDAKLKQATDIFGTSDSVPAIAAAVQEVQALIGNRRTALTRGTYLEGSRAPTSGPSGLVPTLRFNPATGQAEPIK